MVVVAAVVAAAAAVAAYLHWRLAGKEDERRRAAGVGRRRKLVGEHVALLVRGGVFRVKVVHALRERLRRRSEIKGDRCGDSRRGEQQCSAQHSNKHC